MFAERGHEVLVIYRDPEARELYLAEEGPNLQVLHFPDREEDSSRWPAPYWVYVSHLFAEATRWAMKEIGHPDVLETVDGFAPGYFTLQRKLTMEKGFRDLPIVCTCHTPIYLMRRANRKTEWLLEDAAVFHMEKCLLEGADQISVPSRYMRDLVAGDLGIPPDRFNLVHCPFHLPAHAVETRSNENKIKRDRFYMASRVEYWKGALHLARLMGKSLGKGARAFPSLLWGRRSLRLRG